MFCRVVAVLLVLAGFEARAANISAARAVKAPNIDGKVDEDAWQIAPVYSDFVEQYPKEGEPPTQKTEVRVLYDDTMLYVAIICFDSEPSQIVRALGRRDSTPTADLLELAIDSSFDRRSAYYFSVNAAGVLRDGLLFGDVNLLDTWDSVWSGAVSQRPDGWSAELAIPLAILRFPTAKEQQWGFHVRRTIPRTHQVFDSTLLPRSANALVSRFGQLTDVLNLQPSAISSSCRTWACASRRGPNTQTPRCRGRSCGTRQEDIGLDLRASLFSDLTLNATINPDFGQVEADQIILNLTTTEVFFPEKRPFFNEGLDLFQPVGFEYGARRISCSIRGASASTRRSSRRQRSRAPSLRGCGWAFSMQW